MKLCALGLLATVVSMLPIVSHAELDPPATPDEVKTVEYHAKSMGYSPETIELRIKLMRVSALFHQGKADSKKYQEAFDLFTVSYARDRKLQAKQSAERLEASREKLKKMWAEAAEIQKKKEAENQKAQLEALVLIARLQDAGTPSKPLEKQPSGVSPSPYPQPTTPFSPIGTTTRMSPLFPGKGTAFDANGRPIGSVRADPSFPGKGTVYGSDGKPVGRVNIP